MSTVGISMSVLSNCTHSLQLLHRSKAKSCVVADGRQLLVSRAQTSGCSKTSATRRIAWSRLQHRTRRIHRCVVRTHSSAERMYVERCAEELVSRLVHSNSIVGLGTGVMVNAIIDCLSKKTERGLLQGVRCVPASDVSASEAAFQGVTVTSLAEQPVVDIMFEEVDEIVLQDPELPFIAGRMAEPVQPNLLRMRELLAASKSNVMLIDGVDQTTAKLRGVLPVVVDADVWEDAGEALDDIFIPDAEIWRRSITGYDPEDPRAVANPYLSAQGHNVLDVKFYGSMKLFGEHARYQKIVDEVASLDGVITHGLFVNVASTAAIFTAEGLDLIDAIASIS